MITVAMKNKIAYLEKKFGHLNTIKKKNQSSLLTENKASLKEIRASEINEEGNDETIDMISDQDEDEDEYITLDS